MSNETKVAYLFLFWMDQTETCKSKKKGRLKRYHKSDGLVLTHTGPYAAGLGDFSFKWKYPELISIDFQLIRTHRQIELHLAGNNKVGSCVRWYGHF